MNSLILKWNRRVYAGSRAKATSCLAALSELGRVILLREGGVPTLPDHRYPSPNGRRGLPLDPPPFFSWQEMARNPLYWQGFADFSRIYEWGWNRAATSSVCVLHSHDGGRTCSDKQSNGWRLAQALPRLQAVATRWVNRPSSGAAQVRPARWSRTAIRSSARPWALRPTSRIASDTRRAAEPGGSIASASVVAPATQRITMQSAGFGLTADRAVQIHAFEAVRASLCAGGFFHALAAGANRGPIH